MTRVPSTRTNPTLGAACAVLLVLLTATCSGEPSAPGQPTSVAAPAGGMTPASPQAGRVVVAGTPGAMADDDEYVLNNATITGDTLTISVSYGGGCETHEFTLVISAAFIESSPVQLPVVLRHAAHGDACEAWLTQSYAFDLAIIRTRYREAYGPGAGRIVLRLDGVPEDRLIYEFTA